MIIFSLHMSDDHEDIAPTVMTKAREAGWNQKNVDKIIVVYLSPNEDTRRKSEKKSGRMTPSPHVDHDWVVAQFYSFHDFRCFRGLPWSK